MPNKIYITTTLPYVNADPHIGHALEFIQADVIARFRKLIGEEVFFNTGTDEHGQKIFQKAQKEGIDTQEYVDKYAGRFQDALAQLGVTENHNFIRTTDSNHKKAAQEFWRKCKENGYIEKRQQKIKYCVGCELEKTDSELEDGACVFHPNLEIEIREEENYFFLLSRFQDKLTNFYDKNPNFVTPVGRYNEAKSFVKSGLQDFSISRLKEKMSWGVPVPDDEDHVMYVWFDALVNYVSAIGWPDDTEKFEKWWPVTQFAGKDNVRQQAVMWQAMLMSVGIEPSKNILIHGFINIGAKKISKSLGNVVDPLELVKEHGKDSLRYYLTREVATFEDSDFTMERFKDVYNANLANGLGNLLSRIMKMVTTHEIELDIASVKKEKIDDSGLYSVYYDALYNFKIGEAADEIWRLIGQCDKVIQEDEPFKLIKADPEKAKKILKYLGEELYRISRMLEPFLPETASKIQESIEENKMPEALFKRID